MIEPLVLFLTGVGVIALRTYARVRAVGWKRLQADDYLMFVAIVGLYPGFQVYAQELRTRKI